MQHKTISWGLAAGIVGILALPILNLPPWFSPPDWGKSILFRLIFSTLLFSTLLVLLFKRRSEMLREATERYAASKSLVWILGGLFFWFLLASLFSIDPSFAFWGNPLRGGGFVNFGLLILFAIFSFLFSKQSNWKIFWTAAIVTGVLVSAVAIIQWQGLFSDVFIPEEGGRPMSTMGNSTLLALYLLLLLFPALAIALKKEGWRRIPWLIPALLFLFVIVLTGSRGGYLGLATGLAFFLFFYPTENKKGRQLFKLLFLVLLFIPAGALYFANVHYSTLDREARFTIEKNRALSTLIGRFTIAQIFIQEPRFAAWRVGIRAIAEKPVFGWGMEHFPVAFDKHYDPQLPNIQYIPNSVNSWWDRAHNLLIDGAIQGGIPGLALYLALIGILLVRLQKLKREFSRRLTAHGLQAGILGWFAASLFGFDTFSTSLIFFFLVAYSLHLISESTRDAAAKNPIPRRRNVWERLAAQWNIPLLLVFALLFFWSAWAFSLKPFLANAQINRADSLVGQQKCQEALLLMDQAMKKDQGFLNSFFGFTYADLVLRCRGQALSESRITLMEQSKEAVAQALKSQPSYTRGWIALGGFANILLENEMTRGGDPKTIERLFQEAESAFRQALALSPKHQEIYIEWAKTSLVVRDFQGAKEKANACISLYSETGACWWLLARTEISQGHAAEGQQAIQQAVFRRYDTESEQSLLQLANAYAQVSSFGKLVAIYEKLVQVKPLNPQYRASLATAYKSLGRIVEAREQALKALELQPELRKNVEQFLQAL